VLYGLGDFIVTGVSAFLFIPLYLKYLSAEEYGIYNVLNTNLTLFTYIFQLGIVSAYARIYFLRKADNTEKEYTWYVVFFHLLYSILLFLIYFLFEKTISDLLSPSISNSKLGYYSVLMAFLAFLPALYYIFLRLEEKANRFVFYQILTVLLLSISVLFNYCFYELNLNTFLVSFLFSNLIIWIITVFNLKISFSFNFFFKDISETIVFAFPIFISYIAYFFLSKYSILILQNHISLDQIGKFSLAQQIATIPTLVTVAIAKAVQPMLFSAMSDNELQVKSQSLDSSFKLILIWIVGSLIFFIDIIFHFFLPVKYFSIVETTKYMLLVNLVYNYSIVENSILLYKMKSKIILIITVCGSVLNIILCNLLVGKYEINGIVFSMALAFSLNLCLSIYFSRKYIPIKYDVKLILGSLCFIIFFIFFSSSKLFNHGYFFKNLFSTVCFFIYTIALSLIFKKKYATLNIK
jgi:O-antigen/teichoic acid export membrane protein